MSIYSDYKVGAMDDVEFHNACVEENMRDRWEREHEYDGYDNGDLEIDYEYDEYPLGFNPYQE